MQTSKREDAGYTGKQSIQQKLKGLGTSFAISEPIFLMLRQKLADHVGRLVPTTDMRQWLWMHTSTSKL